MILTIETDEMKITLSVGPGGVVIDPPVTMDEETRQTTLSEAQWVAYAKGREDERRDLNEKCYGIIRDEFERGNCPPIRAAKS